jgi:hypothetical protein
MKILAAKLERKTAAWPAELPPPTSAISSRRHIRASMGDAQYQMPPICTWELWLQNG